MPSFMDYLKQFEEEYKKAEVKPSRSSEPVPDGTYKARVDRVELVTSKNSGKPLMVWELAILDDPYHGERVTKFNGLDTQDKIAWLKQDLFKAGLELENLPDLEQELIHLLDRVLEIHLKTKTTQRGKIQNIYINKRLKDQEEEPANLKDLEIPF
ncbi:DUF669 domain-containing protein [Laceyella tengchongensis]|jgi:hypothetical protein